MEATEEQTGREGERSEKQEQEHADSRVEVGDRTTKKKLMERE